VNRKRLNNVLIGSPLSQKLAQKIIGSYPQVSMDFLLLGRSGGNLALLWQIQFTPQSRADPLSAVRAALKRSHDEIDDSVAHGWQAWLGWRSVDSFFPASLG
jgi:hypothetical protein